MSILKVWQLTYFVSQITTRGTISNGYYTGTYRNCHNLWPQHPPPKAGKCFWNHWYGTRLDLISHS